MERTEILKSAYNSDSMEDKILEFKESNNFSSKVYKHSYDADILIPHGELNDIFMKNLSNITSTFNNKKVTFTLNTAKRFRIEMHIEAF